MTDQATSTQMFSDDNREEIEALSKLFDYLTASLRDAGSTKASYAVQAAKSIMQREFEG